VSEIQLSVLDLAIVRSGSTSAEALAETTRLAQQADALGYERFWVAEHHNMAVVASTSPPVLMAHLAANTERIRVGSGGVMLPNHAPFVVAEQFAMLEALYPGRVDLGIGRAPGTDGYTAQALRRGSDGSEDNDFPRHVIDVLGLLGDERSERGLHAQMGGTRQAADIYLEYFEPSAALSEPHLIVTATVMAADTAEEAQHLLAPHRLRKYAMRHGQRFEVVSPDEAKQHPSWRAAEQAPFNAIAGTGVEVAEGLAKLAAEMQATEIMITAPTWSLDDRLSTLDQVMANWGELQPA